MYRLQHRLRHAAGGVADAGLPGQCYGVFTLEPSQFVGYLDAGLSDVKSLLEARSYSYSPLSAKKLHPEYRRPDGDSIPTTRSQRLDPNDPIPTTRSRRPDPDDRSKQWHVHLWEHGGGLEVFSHYEFRLEPWDPIDLRRPVDHYWPEWGETCLLGQHCSALKSLLEEHGTYRGESDAPGSVEFGVPARP